MEFLFDIKTLVAASMVLAVLAGNLGHSYD